MNNTEEYQSTLDWLRSEQAALMQQRQMLDQQLQALAKSLASLEEAVAAGGGLAAPAAAAPAPAAPAAAAPAAAAPAPAAPAPAAPVATRSKSGVGPRFGITQSILVILGRSPGVFREPTDIRTELKSSGFTAQEYRNLLQMVHSTLRRLEHQGTISKTKSGRALYMMPAVLQEQQ
jgi:hypothetical protein